MKILLLLLAAQSGPDTWSGLAPLPADNRGCIIATDADTLYFAPGYQSNAFTRYSISTNSWTWAASPGYIGGRMAVMPGTASIYMMATSWRAQHFMRYSMTGDSWEELPALPRYAPNGAIAATGTKVYYLCGDAKKDFWEYTPGGDWTAAAETPSDVYPGTALSWPGGDWIYAVSGSHFWAYSTSGQTWTALPDGPFWMTDVGGALGAGPNHTLLCVPGGGSGDTDFRRYTITGAGPDGTWDHPAELPHFSQGGSVAWPGAGDTVFIAPGNGIRTLWSYAANTAVFTNDSIAAVPAPIRNGSAMTSLGDGSTIYLAAGNNTNRFLRYTASDNAWTPMANLPHATLGGSIVHDGGDFLYLSTDAGDLLRYAISTDTWVTRTASGRAGPMVFIAPDTIYAFGGASQATRASRYSIAANAWTDEATLTGAPRQIAASYPGWGDSIFVLRGGNMLADLSAYSLSAHSWSAAPADPADGVGSVGVALCSDGGAHLYAFFGRADDSMGSNDTRFWSYDIMKDGWGTVAPAAAVPSSGAALAWAGKAPYVYALLGGGLPDFKRYWFRDTATSGAVKAPAQLRSDGTTAIPAGGTTEERSVILRGVLPDDVDGDPQRLAAELKLATEDFNGSGVLRGAFLAAGSTATLRFDGLLRGAHYHWRVRGEDTRGHDTGWVAGSDFTVLGGQPPLQPTLATQWTPDGATPVAANATIVNVTGFRVKAPVSDPNGDETVRLEVQVNPVDQPFVDETTNLFTGAAVASGGTAVVDVTGRAINAAYSWRARAVDEAGTRSAWFSFPGDIRLRSNIAPAIDTMGQAAGRFPVLGTGQHAYAESVEIEVSAVDSHGDALTIEVEVLGSPVQSSGVVASGDTVRFTIPLGYGAWRWRARATDRFGAVSAWTDHGGNPDFVLDPRGGSESAGACSAAGRPGMLLLAILAVLAMNCRGHSVASA